MPDGYFDSLPIPRKNVDLAGMQQNIASLQSGLAQEILDREAADATKANKSTTINGKSLEADRVIYAQDVPSKNLLPNNIESQSSYYGVDITRNADGSLTFNGTASSTFAIVINFEVSLASGTYILSGCPSGGHTPTDGANDNYLIRGRFSTSSAWLTDIGDGIQFTGSNLKDISIRIASGYTCSNLTFRPMIRLASIEDDSYVPYAKTNVELSQGGAGSNYTRLPDGTQICWGRFRVPGGSASAWAGVYHIEYTLNEAFPVPFISNPSVTATCDNESSGVVDHLVWTSEKITGIGVVRQTATDYQKYFSYIAVGRWK